MVKTKKWILRKPFEGIPKREDLEIVEEELPPLKDGGWRKMFLIRCLAKQYTCTVVTPTRKVYFFGFFLEGG